MLLSHRRLSAVSGKSEKMQGQVDSSGRIRFPWAHYVTSREPKSDRHICANFVPLFCVFPSFFVGFRRGVF